VALLAYSLIVDQLADSSSTFFTLYPPGTLLPVPVGTTPVDLTGAHARMMVRAHPADLVPIVSLTDTANAQGVLVLGGGAGTVRPKLTKAATALLIAETRGARLSTYLFDLFIDFPDGTSLNIVGGPVLASLAVTH
jgi:hypothetical protein